MRTVPTVLLPVLGSLALSPPTTAQQDAKPGYEMGTEAYAVAPTRSGPVELEVDLYRPVAGPVRGAVVLMHGGGFTGGRRGLGENRAYGAALARRGYLAAAMSYRLAGDDPVVEGWAAEYARAVREHRDPRMVRALEEVGPVFADAVAAAGEDLVALVEWLRRRAPALGFAPDDIAVFGASAGSITALTTVYAMEAYGAAPLDVAGVIDLRGLLLLPEGADDPFEADDPPLLLLHGEADRRVTLADAEAVFRLAREAGTPVELYTAPGYGHELGGEALLSLRLDRRHTVLDRIDDFLRSAFGGDPAPRSLRGRLLSAVDPAEGTADTAADSLFRAELTAAVARLVEAVRGADDFVPSLYGVSRTRRLEHDLHAAVRRDWSYWPRARAGLPIRHMDAGQRTLTRRILAALLSAKGYLQVHHIMMLEEVLAGLETVGFTRGAEEYTVAVFGEPTPAGSWGLRFEGHHLSLNVTVTPDDVSVTPSFLGAAPAPLRAGPRAGFDPLAYERRRALELLRALDEKQRDAAILDDEPPAGILTTQFRVEPAEWDRWRERLARDGIAASTFDRRQRGLLRDLLAEIVGTYHPRVGRAWLDTVDIASLTFAWLGPPDIDRAHYFRIQGHDFVFELDAAQDDGHHVHTVWRDRWRDFGDPLEEHYRRRH